MKILAFFFCFLIGDQAWQLRAQEASGVFAPSFDDYFAAATSSFGRLSFQVQFETPFQTIPTVATTPPVFVDAATNGFSASFAGLLEHPMNAGLREAAGIQSADANSFAIVQERPAFAFGNPDSGGGGVRFARNSAADGMGQWNIETVVPPENSDRGFLYNLTLLPLQNAPVIVLRQSELDSASTTGGETNTINFAIASDDAGHGPWRIVPSGLPSGLYDPANFSLVSNFEIASNRVIVAFLDQSMTSLFLASAPAALDGSAWEIAPILTSPAPLSGVSIAVINGETMISYAAAHSNGYDLYLAGPYSAEHGWASTRLGYIGSVPWVQTALSEYGGQIFAEYAFNNFQGGSGPRGPASSFAFFVAPVQSSERTWREFSGSGEGFLGRWSTLQGRPVEVSYLDRSLGLWTLPEVHWRATAGSQLSINRGTPSYSLDLSATYDLKLKTGAAVAATDLNGDKIPDLIVLGWVTNSPAVSVLLGDGSGSFKTDEGSPILLSTNALSAEPPQIQAGDLNGDGELDVVVALWDPPTAGSKWSSGMHFCILLGDGTGGLREPLDSAGAPVSFRLNDDILQTSSTPAFALADLNGDGRDELVINPLYSRRVLALQFNAGEQLTSAPGFPIQLSQPGGGLFANDVNNDGRMDLVVINLFHPDNSDGPPITLLIRNPDGSFTSNTVGESEYTIRAGMADLNNDGNTDLLVVGTGAHGGLTSFLGDGAGSFRRVDSGWSSDSDVLMDVNSDGILDLVENPFVRFGDGTGRFGNDHQLENADVWPTFAADLNGDGHSDLVGLEGNRVRVWLYPSPGTSALDLSLIGIPWYEYELFWKDSLDSPDWVSIGRTWADEYGHISTFHQTSARTGFYRAVEVPAP